MRSPKLKLISLVLFASPLIAESPPETTEWWSIQAGRIVWSAGSDPIVSGSFRINPPSSPADTKATAPQGGACLVANLVPFGIGRATCSTHADCNAPDAIDKQHDPRLAAYTGYCATRDGSSEAPTCWTRPGTAESHCKRTIGDWKMAEGAHQLDPVNGDPLGMGRPYPDWAVYACMARPGHDRACGEPLNPNRQISLTPVPAGLE